MNNILEKIRFFLNGEKQQITEKKKIESKSFALYRGKTEEKTMALKEKPTVLSPYFPWFKDDDDKDSDEKNMPDWYLANARIYDLKITIGEADRLKIFEFVKAAPVEVYIPTLVKRRGNHFHLYKPLFLKQKGEKSGTDIDLQDEDRYIRELLESNRPFEEVKEEIFNKRCWIHSHFGRCWWSREDDLNCERATNKDLFLISVVVRAHNNAFYYNCRLDLFPPSEEISEKLESFSIYWPKRLTLTDLFIEVIDDRGPDFDPEKIKQEAQNLVNEKVEISRRKSDKKIEDNNCADNAYEYDPESFREPIGYPLSPDDDDYYY